MALVAYASSDSGCSDDDDVDEVTIPAKKQQQVQESAQLELVNKTDSDTAQSQTSPITNCVDGVKTPANSADQISDPHISDEEDIIYPLPNSADAPRLSLPAPKHSATGGPENGLGLAAENDGHSQSLESGLLAGLPQPKTSESKDGKKEAIVMEDELEDIVKAKPTELAMQERPPVKKKTRQPVKIMIPALQDGEEEDEEPTRKKIRPASGKGGLLSFLPPPQQTITKQTNRRLVPHTLSKKPATATAPKRRPPPTLPAKKTPSVLPGIDAADDSDDEDDDNTNSFFSFVESIKDTTVPVKQASFVDIVKPVEAVNSPVEAVNIPIEPVPGPVLVPQKPCENDSETSQADDAPLEFPDLSDAPLQFSQTQPSYGGSRSWTSPTEPVQGFGCSDNQSDAVVYPDGEGGEDTGLQIEGKQLLRLQGRQRHGREAIHIIDVHGDDQRSEVEVARNLTEEQNEGALSRKKKDMPTRQQKNKHQITYLAYKAKEQEFDLKHQWSQNKMTRRQTQAKYGF